MFYRLGLEERIIHWHGFALLQPGQVRSPDYIRRGEGGGGGFYKQNRRDCEGFHHQRDRW